MQSDECRPQVSLRAQLHLPHSSAPGGSRAERDRYEYHWEDGETYKRATALSAPAYVEALMSWTQTTLDDERYFPQKIGMSVP